MEIDELVEKLADLDRKDEALKRRWPAFVKRLVTKHRDFNMGDCWYADLHRLRDGAEPESRNADLAHTLEWLVTMYRSDFPRSTDGGST